MTSSGPHANTASAASVPAVPTTPGPAGIQLGGLRLLGAAVGGLALAWSFPPYDVVWLGPVGVATLALAVRGVRVRTGFLLGLAFGAVFFAVLVSWLQVVGTDAWLLLAGYCALWLGLVGAGTVVMSRLRWWPLWVATLWVAQEALRDRVPLGGFPWGRLAFGQTSTPLVSYAALGGAPLVTFASALTGTLLAAALLGLARLLPNRRLRSGRMPSGRSPSTASPRMRTRVIPVALLAAAAAVVLLGAALRAWWPTPNVTADPPTVAIVQGGVPRTGLDFDAQRRAVLGNHVRATLRLAEDVAAGRTPAPSLVIWPENASDVDPFRDATAFTEIDAAAKAIGVPILVGALLDAPDNPQEILNSGIVWDPVSGPGQRYAKRHPVPFGEFIPFRTVLAGYTDRFDLVSRDFRAGDEPGVLDMAGVRLGSVICFEVAYDNLVRDVVTGGGQFVVVQTNNATYNGTGQTEQQLAMSRLRAVEHGRSVVVAATSGVSALVQPDGSIEPGDVVPEFTAATLVRSVPVATDLTLADRVGEWPEWALTLAAVSALSGGLLMARRRTSYTGPPGPAV